MRLLRLAALIASLLGPIKLRSEPPADSFLIHVVERSRLSSLQVRSFITGDFGGVGGFEAKPFGEDGLLLSTQYRQQRAKTLRAILYSPGCALQVIRAENLQTAPREADFICQPLAQIRLGGKIDMTEIPDKGDLEVRVQYVAPWSHAFFGIMDGMVMTLDAGTSTVLPDGSFVINLPGFAADPISSNLGRDAYFFLTMRMKTSWNLVALLEVEAPLSATPNGDLTLEDAYPVPVHFLARPIKNVGPK